MEGLVEEEEKSFFTVGAAIDCLLTSPERFEDDFRVVELNEPTGLFGKFIKGLPPNLTPMSDTGDYMMAYIKSGYKKPIDWVINNFWNSPEGVAYYEARYLVEEDKLLLPKNIMEQVNKAVELIKVNEYTAPYFFNTSIDKELIHQLPVYFEYRGVECKALLDGVVISHKDRTITPFDLKSTGKSV